MFLTSKWELVFAIYDLAFALAERTLFMSTRAGKGVHLPWSPVPSITIDREVAQEMVSGSFSVNEPPPEAGEQQSKIDAWSKSS